MTKDGWSVRLLLAGFLVSLGVGMVARPAGASLPTQPAQCGFTLGAVNSQEGLGTDYFGLSLVPAVKYQQCSTVGTFTASITTSSGSAPAGVSPNSAADVETVSFYPNRPDPEVRFGWSGADGCTTTAEPIRLILSDATQSVVGFSGMSRSCRLAGPVPGSGIYSETSLGSSVPYADGIASTPNGAGYRITDDVGFVTGKGSPQLLVREPLSYTPIVGIAAAPSGDGDWLVASNGGVFSYGSATFHGTASRTALNAPIVGMAAR